MVKQVSITLLIAIIGLISFNAFSADKVTMSGTYKSIKYGSGPMTGVFTKTASKKYDAVFNFTWKKKNYTYSGTVEGNLKKGNISGIIFNETKKRRFIFKAKTSNGKICGTQWETYGKRKKKPRGTFEIKK
jgi:hypothetical protein